MTKEEVISRLKENPLDRERWIEAGKAMGWIEDGACYCTHCIAARIEKQLDLKGGYLYHWHRFIDKLASGGTVDEFFRDL